LFQLRSGHIPLQAHLHKIHATASPLCARCQLREKETPFHVIMRCPAYNAQREELRKASGYQSLSFPHLLSHTKLFPSLFAFLRDINRLVKNFGTITPPQLKDQT
ncbi:hypothetical protein BDN72DRAFT_781493, partial [Pluteus cervinus]